MSLENDLTAIELVVIDGGVVLDEGFLATDPVNVAGKFRTVIIE